MLILNATSNPIIKILITTCNCLPVKASLSENHQNCIKVFAKYHLSAWKPTCLNTLQIKKYKEISHLSRDHRNKKQ